VAKDFRFGVALSTLKSRSQWRDAVRRVEDFGYDVLHLPDHLVTPAPFAALLSAAEVTTMRLRRNCQYLWIGVFQATSVPAC